MHIEGIQGTTADDVIRGNRLSNKLDGWYGDDRLLGLGRRDSLDGNVDDDVLLGGGGRPDRADGGNGSDRCVAEDERNCES